MARRQTRPQTKSRRSAAGRADGRTAERAGRRTANQAQTSPADEEQIVDAALALAADRGWRSLTLAEIAEAAGVSLAALYAVLPSKGAILDAFARRIDRATLSGLEPASQSSDSVRDRLFEVIMRSFDALEPHKRAVATLMAELPRQPLAAFCQSTRLLRSLSWMAGAAGVDTSGPFGLLRVHALAGAYLWILRAWLGDDTQDKARTMEALDRALKNLEMLAASVPRLRRTPREA